MVTWSHGAMAPLDLRSPGQTVAVPRLSSNANKPHLSVDGTRSDVTLKATFAKKKKTYKLLWSLISFVCFTLFFNGK